MLAPADAVGHAACLSRWKGRHAWVAKLLSREEVFGFRAMGGLLVWDGAALEAWAGFKELMNPITQSEARQSVLLDDIEGRTYHRGALLTISHLNIGKTKRIRRFRKENLIRVTLACCN